jgi:hypothetical protein
VNFSLAPLQLKNIIWGYQNAARVEKPYAMITYATGKMPEHEYYGSIDENGLRINSSWRKAIVTLSFFCGQMNSYNFASKACSLIMTEASIAKQVELDVSIGHRLFLQHVPALLNESQYEDRAIYQFEFYYTENIPDDVGRIETVILDGTYSGSITDTDGSAGSVTCHEVISSQDVFVLPVTKGDK